MQKVQGIGLYVPLVVDLDVVVGEEHDAGSVVPPPDPNLAMLGGNCIKIGLPEN